MVSKLKPTSQKKNGTNQTGYEGPYITGEAENKNIEPRRYTNITKIENSLDRSLLAKSDMVFSRWFSKFLRNKATVRYENKIADPAVIAPTPIQAFEIPINELFSAHLAAFQSKYVAATLPTAHSRK